MNVLRIQVTVLVEPDGDGFHAYCPNLKGLHMDGKTEEETLENMEAGIVLYLESLAKHGDPLPVGPFLSVECEEMPEVPVGAFLRSLQVQWPPTHGMSGVN